MEKPVILARLGNPLLHLPQTWGRKVRDERLVIPLSQRLCGLGGEGIRKPARFHVHLRAHSNARSMRKCAIGANVPPQD